MSKVLETKLIEVYKKLQTSETNINTSKKSIADALRFNGITNVSDTETFVRYAELVRRLKSANAMIFEFTIPETPLDGTDGGVMTDYKRTVVLPMYFSSANTGSVLGQTSTSNVMNAIAKEVIANDEGVYPISVTTMDLNTVSNKVMDIADLHIVEDMYGNMVTDGNYTSPITMNDVETYLTTDQQEEMSVAMKNLGIKLTALEDGNGTFEPNTEAVYSFTVDWGDGSEIAIFDLRNGRTYEDNKNAIWHTYKKSGTYQVSINGVFKRLYSNTTSWSNFVDSGQKVIDKDGKYALLSGINYNMRYGLTSVIAWGNTMLTNMANGFCYCENLNSIPMYDTTNSFIDVTDFSYTFYRCSTLKSLPFNANTNKGLFSGCEKATTFAQCFSYCTGMTGEIPVKLIDGCKNVESVAGMFAYSKFSGNIPVGLLEGMDKLTNASEMFANCSLSGELSSDLFKDNPNITNIYRLFYGCSGVTGKIEREFIGGLSKLTDMRQAFYNCKGITGFASDAFYNIKSDDINCRDAFYGSGIQSIPAGLLSAMTGKNLMMERMFGNCVSLTSVDSTALANLKVANARGMFGGCTSLASVLPSANPDWNTLDGMNRWYGAFAMCPLNDINTVCIELGGKGERKFEESKVGKIVFSDGTYKEFTEYISNTEGVKPIGVVYADIYLDSTKMRPDLDNVNAENGVNLVDWGKEGANHRIYACVFNDTTKPWTNGQENAEDVTTITNTSNVEVSYHKYTWNDSGAATLNPTRYNGEAYTKALREWIGVDGASAHKDKYDALQFVEDYKLVDDGVTISDKISKFLPDAADLWDQFTMKYFIQQVINKIIEVNSDKTIGTAVSNGTNSGNCYSMRDGTYYWASAEYSSTGAWDCYTLSAGVYYGNGKWGSIYVRPSFALDA